MPETGRLLWYIMWIGVIGVGAMLIGIIVARVLMKRLRTGVRTQGFTIQELLEMRDGGRITQEEYEAMRAAVIGQITADSAAPSRKDPGPQPAGGPEGEDDTEGAASGPAPDDRR
jgi:hypothetical protein